MTNLLSKDTLRKIGTMVAHPDHFQTDLDKFRTYDQMSQDKSILLERFETNQDNLASPDHLETDQDKFSSSF